ncbi:hypothetical protein A5700_16965 [Mycobacterium sp. E1214]|uniref:hypothetical protein n=1 Tax=Mycobacterium sp. E1214 TaxID=1834123 RepID=UPI0007FE9A2A|nr:hypothetical protein [Mycobacterium sp. E1214]OBG78312.1 hypothetical protein A5700_16965 [Mycobacterium sp. E1214]
MAEDTADAKPDAELEAALDDLYRAPPTEFTAHRTRLAAAAKKRGDAAAAKRLGAAHKPTTAAWIVNRLALTRSDTAGRLAELGDRLRDAHAAMDGASIRELSAQQHRLIGELARDALRAAGVDRPSSSVRDDVTSTLQAAVADPDVRGRLGRLERPEQWSGFGGPAAADRAGRAPRRTPRAPARSGTAAAASAARDRDRARRRDELNAAVATAQRHQEAADDALARAEAARAAARRSHEEARRALGAAERALGRAEDEHAEAERASRAAAQSLREAQANLRRA